MSYTSHICIRSCLLSVLMGNKCSHLNCITHPLQPGICSSVAVDRPLWSRQRCHPDSYRFNGSAFWSWHHMRRSKWVLLTTTFINSQVLALHPIPIKGNTLKTLNSKECQTLKAGEQCAYCFSLSFYQGTE